MLIVFYSYTGNIKRFLKKAGYIDQAIPITDDLLTNEKYILVTPTLGFGEIPKDVVSFLKKRQNRENIAAVIGSGNKNWGENYCGAAKKIAKKLNIPNIFNFELAGNQHDLDEFKKIISGEENEKLYRVQQ